MPTIGYFFMAPKPLLDIKGVNIPTTPITPRSFTTSQINKNRVSSLNIMPKDLNKNSIISQRDVKIFFQTEEGLIGYSTKLSRDVIKTCFYDRKDVGQIDPKQQINQLSINIRKMQQTYL